MSIRKKRIAVALVTASLAFLPALPGGAAVASPGKRHTKTVKRHTKGGKRHTKTVKRHTKADKRHTKRHT